MRTSGYTFNEAVSIQSRECLGQAVLSPEAKINRMWHFGICYSRSRAINKPLWSLSLSSFSLLLSLGLDVQEGQEPALCSWHWQLGFSPVDDTREAFFSSFFRQIQSVNISSTLQYLEKVLTHRAYFFFLLFATLQLQTYFSLRFYMIHKLANNSQNIKQKNKSEMWCAFAFSPLHEYFTSITAISLLGAVSTSVTQNLWPILLGKRAQAQPDWMDNICEQLFYSKPCHIHWKAFTSILWLAHSTLNIVKSKQLHCGSEFMFRAIDLCCNCERNTTWMCWWAAGMVLKNPFLNIKKPSKDFRQRWPFLSHPSLSPLVPTARDPQSCGRSLDGLANIGIYTYLRLSRRFLSGWRIRTPNM